MPVRRSADNPILWAYRKDRDYTQMTRTMQEWLADELSRPGTPYPRGLASVAATRYARQERGTEPAVRFAVRLSDGSHYGEFVCGDEGWRWL